MLIELLIALGATAAMVAVLIALRLTAGAIAAGAVVVLIVCVVGLPGLRGSILQSFVGTQGSGLPLFGSDHEQLHYRVTVGLTSNAGPIVGSVVQGMALSVGGLNGKPTINGRNSGEALVVDVPNGGVLVVTMETAAGKEQYSSLYGIECVGRAGSDESPMAYIARATTHEGKCIVPPQDWPIFIYAPSPRDPSSFSVITPDQFPKILGASIESITFERTDDPLTSSIFEIFRWLSLENETGNRYFRQIRGAPHADSSYFYIPPAPG